MKPLEGYRIIELVGIGPGPYSCQLLADLGAEVIAVGRPGQTIASVDARGKTSVMLDLRKPGAAEVILKLVENADALIEGNRPGVTERLGIGPEACFARNPKLVYGRMTGWGQTGPWAGMAGHDINYISVTGALLAMGKEGEPPAPPLNLVGDYGGGSLFMVMGVLAALMRAEKTGKGDIVDAAIIDGVSSMMGILHSLAGVGAWSPARSSNLLDGGAPFYRCYKTSDDKFMAAGAIEPQFFAKMLEILRIDPIAYGKQNDRGAWPRQHALLEAVFATKTRDEWAVLFDATDACVTPVLDYQEAARLPQNLARASHVEANGLIHPHIAPRFAGEADDWSPADVQPLGEQTEAVLKAAGLSDEEMRALADSGAIKLREESQS